MVVERVTVVKFRVDNRGSDGTGRFRIKVRTDTAELLDMRIAELRKIQKSCAIAKMTGRCALYKWIE